MSIILTPAELTDEHCQECEADLFDVAADLLEDEWTQERRVQG